MVAEQVLFVATLKKSLNLGNTANDIVLEVAENAAEGTTKAYEIASQGGKHSGFYKQYINKPVDQIKKGINKLKKQIGLHQEKIKNPTKHIKDFYDLDPRQQQALINKKWPSDIQRQQEQLNILEDILKEMGN